MSSSTHNTNDENLTPLPPTITLFEPKYSRYTSFLEDEIKSMKEIENFFKNHEPIYSFDKTGNFIMKYQPKSKQNTND